jgi:CysZ protein
MIRAFDLAIRQLGDPRLRGIIWQSLALSLVLQIAIGVVACSSHLPRSSGTG